MAAGEGTRGVVVNDRQVRFAQEYCVDHNATQAAIRAGYAAKTANIHSSRLLANASVRARIAEVQAKLALRVEVSQERVVEGIIDVGFSNITDIISWDADGSAFHMVASEDLPAAVRRSVKKIKVKRTRQVSGSRADPEVWEIENIEIELHDKLKALELIGKHVGMWPAKPVEINANIHVNVQQAVANLSRMTPDELRALARAKAPLLALPPPSDEVE